MIKILSSRGVEGFPERLALAISSASSVRSFALAAGVTAPAMNAYLSGTSAPGLKALVGIAKASGYNLEWLATGDGEMVKSSSTLLAGDATTDLVVQDSGRLSVQGHEYVIVPRYEVAASAGAGAFVDLEPLLQPLALSAEWVRRSLRANPDDLIVLTATGDSMEPTIRDKDVLLVDVSRAINPQNGVYVVNLDGRVLVKRLKLGRKRTLTLVSDNEGYEPIDIEEGDPDLAVVGRVIWIGKEFG